VSVTHLLIFGAGRTAEGCHVPVAALMVRETKRLSAAGNNDMGADLGNKCTM
jgi:hypothetical protein